MTKTKSAACNFVLVSFFIYIQLFSFFSIIREDLTNVDMSQIRNSDIDSEHFSPDKTNFIIKSPTNKSIKVFKDLHFVLSYAKYKRIPMANDSSDQGTDHDASYSKLKFII